MSTASPFTYEIETSRDEATGRVAAIALHGRLVAENTPEFKALIKPLIHSGGRIVLNFSDVSFIDSSGLGALVVLKLASIKEDYGTLEYEHFSERMQELLTLSNLHEIFKS